MKIKISLILPYYNEKKSVSKTLSLIDSQTISPDEVIFINSNSSDSTSIIIDNFIESKNKINWHNFNTKLETPSEAKNFGINKSKCDWCAFMDFDIYFPSNWIENQITFISGKKNILISFGVIKLNPKNYFDRLVISQTYGINSNNPVIPSSFINKNYFNNFGLFLPYRSFYDKIFIKQAMKNNINFIFINDNNPISYFDINYAKNLSELFYKTLNYTIQSVYIDKNIVPYIYLILLSIFILLIIIDINFTPLLFLLTFILRGLVLPIKKNKKFFQIFNLKDIPNIFLIGVFIDFVKCIGFSLGLILRIFKKKIRLDYIYK